MPSSATITSFFTFTPLSTIVSSQMNTNLGTFRGHLLSVEPLTATSSHLTYDIGAADHMWRGAYTQYGVMYQNTAGSIPAAPASGQMAMYFKTDNILYSKSPAGAELAVGPPSLLTSDTPPPVVQSFTSSSGTCNLPYTFTINSGSATVGATYTNNSVTFTVYATVASATRVVMTGGGAPASSGTLTKTGGTGDSTLTFSLVKTPIYLEAIVVAAGGGGGGSGTASGGTGGTGGSSTFGTSLLTAVGGVGGAWQADFGGAGGAGTVSAGAVGIRNVTGGWGGVGGNGTSAAVYMMGGQGGSGPMGGAGSGSWQATGKAGVTNTGGGGGGGGPALNASAIYSGAGGGAGAFIQAIITPLSASYAYSVGAAGTAGSAGTSGTGGGAGGSGYIAVTAYFQ